MFAYKEKVIISESDPVFSVRYLGHQEISQPHGKGCTQAAVERLWNNASKECDICRARLTIGLKGVYLEFLKENSEEHHDIKFISYCCVDGTFNHRIFSWVVDQRTASIAETAQTGTKTVSSSPDRRYLCHAALFSKAEKAIFASSQLIHVFRLAYTHWKNDSKRAKRHEQMKLLTTKDGLGLLQQPGQETALECDNCFQENSSHSGTTDNSSNTGELEDGENHSTECTSSEARATIDCDTDEAACGTDDAVFPYRSFEINENF